jgi:predicted XRE-type DNA-binding protein
MSDATFTSVWDAIEDPQAAAESMKLRSSIMIALKTHIVQSGLCQAEAARVLCVTQPRLADFMRGKINAFSLEDLVAMASAIGMQFELRVVKPPEAA